MSELADEVRRRSGLRCEYCGVPQAAFRRSFHIEHIVARQHGGATHIDNLALACWHCNLKKGPNLAGVDPQSGQVVSLFHPRKDRWPNHFAVHLRLGDSPSLEIHGLTPTGRATVRVLGINDDFLPMLRYEFWLEGLYKAPG